MFDLDQWLGGEQRSDRYKQVQAIELPYKCGKIEAELIFYRFINNERQNRYDLIQPLQTRLMLL
ncbi:MAG: hypothetical protein DCE90_18055 [Pseudanabaena sp.]|nr:MAG: hypothetical protein DCE90_18055 [Pseudanabaena sp.]